MNAKSTRVRSPSYPAISLKLALKKVQDFYDVEGRNEAYITVALGHWSYSQTSGNGLKLVAALSSYGLIDTSGSGKNRKLKLSELALRIVLDNRDNSIDKVKAIQGIALKPIIHQKLWNKWGASLPSTETMRHHLIFEEKFNEKFVSSFIKDYRETIEFAELNNIENLEESIDSDINFDKQENDEQKQAIEKETDSSKNFGHKVNLSKSDIEIAKYPVAKNCTIRIIANGPFNKKAIEALVAQLNLNLELGVFDDELDLEN